MIINYFRGQNKNNFDFRRNEKWKKYEYIFPRLGILQKLQKCYLFPPTLSQYKSTCNLHYVVLNRGLTLNSNAFYDKMYYMRYAIIYNIIGISCERFFLLQNKILLFVSRIRSFKTVMLLFVFVFFFFFRKKKAIKTWFCKTRCNESRIEKNKIIHLWVNTDRHEDLFPLVT